MKPSILVGDISDYLEPSLVCIKKEDQPPKENTVVTINLTDCLACAGCITSAETILVAQQSWEMVENAIKENIQRYENQYGEIIIQNDPNGGGMGFHIPVNPKDEKIN